MMYKGRTIIDVRSAMECRFGCVENSVNIPLDEIEDRIEEIRNMDNPILCCASGARSGVAATYLKSLGIECENGGGWREVEHQLQMEK